MNRLLSILLLVLTFATTACVVPLPNDTPTALTTPSPVAITPEARSLLELKREESVRFNLPPDARPTVENPTMELHVVLTDKTTGEPVQGAIYLGDRLLNMNTNELMITLGGETEHTLTVRAPGYEEWSLGIRYRVVRDKVFTLPVELVPVVEGGEPV